jgi:hypothetical protein
MMKKLSVYLIFQFVIISFLSAQTITIEGVVRNGKTKETLPFATVFINQTTKGSITDSNGHYSIRNLSIGTVELVCTYVGFKAFSVKIEIKSESNIQQNINLTPEVLELKKVEVTATHDEVWNAQLKKFNKIFLGLGQNSKGCKILNPWNIEFKEEKIEGNIRFTATSAQPIEIENMALGYHITFYLKRFESDDEGYTIGGSSKFKELNTNDSALAKLWTNNRAKTFLGSSRHLMNALKGHRSKEEGFDLYFKATPPPYQIRGGFTQQIGKTVFPFKPSSISISEIMKNHYWIYLGAPVLEVHYKPVHSDVPVYPDIPYQVSWLKINGGRLAINEKGVVLNPADLIVYGAMSQTRIADLLPDDYSTEINAVSLFKHDNVPRSNLQEKVYLHIDKDYYYPNETIWIKAYMNYRSRPKMDSLSRVLYVELISSVSKIVTTKILKIEKGVAHGQIELPSTINPGDYFIRAYTEWMLNYSEEEIFVRHVPILRKEERPSRISKKYDDSVSNSFVSIKPSKSIYHQREKIEVEIIVKDKSENIVPSNLSVSVTDLNQTIDNSEETILNTWSFHDEKEPEKIKFPVENGINLTGIVKNKRGKAVAENLLLTKSGSQESILIDTHANGSFQVGNLQVEDTATFLVKSVSPKKQATHIDLLPRYVPPFIKPLITSLKLELDTTRKRSVFNNLKPTLLKPVTITALRIDDQKVKTEYANFAIDGKSLVALNPNSILYGLSARFPFMRINTVYENGLVPVQRVDIKSNYTYGFTSVPEPALFINGLQVNQNGEPIYDILLRLLPDQVERVEINKQASGGSSYSTVYGYRGSISIYLKTNVDPERFNTPLSPSNFFQRIKIDGYQIALEFKAPGYATTSSSTDADFRSTIYWNPELLTSNYETTKINFYAADLVTKYQIKVQGVTTFGKPLLSVAYIEIIK